jgi:putative endonuclease
MNHNQIVGQFGEKLAGEFLIRNGYRIIAKNIKTSYKELDLVAFKNNTLVFVEVKTRTNLRYGSADEALFSRKLKNLKRAIGLYLRNFNKIKFRDIRLDLIAIDIDKFEKTAKIKHYKNVA